MSAVSCSAISLFATRIPSRVAAGVSQREQAPAAVASRANVMTGRITFWLVVADQPAVQNASGCGENGIEEALRPWTISRLCAPFFTGSAKTQEDGGLI